MRFKALNRYAIWTVAVCGLAALVLWAGIAYLLRRDAEDAVTHARAEGQNLARSLAEHVASSVRALDLILIDLREEWAGKGEPFQAHIARLQEHLNQEQVSQVLVANAAGRVTFSTVPGALGLNISQRSFYRVYQERGESGLYISAPQFDSELAQWSLRFTRPIFDAQQRFAGVITLLLPPPALESIYNDIELGAAAVIALVRADGQILARTRDLAHATRVSLADTPGLSQESASSGNYVRKSVTDGTERLYAYQKVPGYALTVYVGQSMQVILAPYRTQRLAYVSAGVLFTCLLAAIALLLISRRSVKDRAESVLREKVRHLQLVYDTSSVAICDATPGGVIKHANRRMAEMFGQPLDRLIGSAYLDYLHPEERAEGARAMQALVSGKVDKLDLERRFLRADGSEFWGHVTGRCIFDENRVLIDWVGVIADITETKKAAQALQQKVADLQLVYDTSSAGIFDVDTRGIITHANRRMGELFGLLPEQLLGRESASLLHAEEREEGRRAIESLMNGTAEMLDKERHYVRGDGSEFWGRITARRMLDAAGRVIGMVGVVVDVTAARQATEALRRNEAQLRELFDAFPLAISRVDRFEHITFANRVYRDFYGEYEGRTVREFVGDETYARIKPAIDIVLSGEGYSYEREALDKDGKAHILQVRYVPDWNARGEIEGYFTLRENITLRRQAEEEIRKLNESLERRVRARTAELSSANAALMAEVRERQAAESSALKLAARLQQTARRLGEAQEAERRRLAAELHDGVSSNLAAIGLNLSMLKRHLDQGDKGSLMQRLTAIINQVDEAKSTVKEISIDLRPLLIEERDLRSALEDYARKFAQSTGIPVAVKGANSGRHLAADKKIALFRIMQEALTNCAKHARARAIEVNFEAQADALLFSVCDDGVGIDLNLGANAEKRNGLGLLSMQERAEAIGAHWHIDSAPGKGTRISVSLGAAA